MKKELKINRRMFLKLGIWISGLASGWGIIKFLNYEPPGDKLEQTITLNEPNSYLNDSKTFVPEVKAWLIFEKEGIYAVSATCTHLGCTLNESEGTLVCPCHGSKFKISGQVIQGPASKALTHFKLTLSEDGRIVIDRRVSVSPSTRLIVNT